MALDAVGIRATYDAQDDTVADYGAVNDFYVQNDLIDTYDAAVISRNADGKVRSHVAGGISRSDFAGSGRVSRMPSPAAR